MAKIDCVPVSQIFDELKEAIDSRREEIKEVVGYYIDPDYDTYKAASDNGQLIVVTLRNDDGKIVGWSLFAISRSMRFKTEYDAENHTIFVDKEYRNKYGLRLVEDGDKFLQRIGVKRARFQNDDAIFCRALRSHGYKIKTQIMEKQYE